MSKQFNFFAHNEDQSLITETILRVIPELYWIPERELHAEMKLKKITSSNDLLYKPNREIIYLVPSLYTKNISLRTLNDGYCRIDGRNCPSIEYSPSYQPNEESVHVGRIWCAYNSDKEFITLYNRLIRALKKNARKIPDSTGFWTYPIAAHKAKRWNYGLGIIHKNLLYSQPLNS